ncbi:unnamed protein product, partial [Meganyctiphanes norvegica]
RPMDMHSFGSGGGVAGSGVQEYSPIVDIESDDSTPSIENDGLPAIIYTSDDSADVGNSDRNFLNPEEVTYIAQNVYQGEDDGMSRQLLLDTSANVSRAITPQPDAQENIPYINHPLGFSNDGEIHQDGPKGDSGFVETVHLQVHNQGILFERSTSVSSTGSSETSPGTPDTAQPLLPEYCPLAEFTEFSGVNYEPLHEHVINKKLGRYMVGEIPINAKYKDTFYVHWNWVKIRQGCVFVWLSTAIAMLCVGIGLLVTMPRGSECNPDQAWWQGTVMYEVFIPGFKDSNADGIGDLQGLIQKIDYIQDLGVKTVRLESIFPAVNYLDNPHSVVNLTGVDDVLGHVGDVAILSAMLHQRDMHLMLNLPLFSFTKNYHNLTLMSHKGSSGIVSSSLSVLSSILEYWLTLGVDGFFFSDLDLLVEDPGLTEAMHNIRNNLDKHTVGNNHKVLMIPLSLLNKLQAHSFPHVDHLLNLVDLIDAPLDLSVSPRSIPDVLANTLAWDNHPSLPWINWNNNAYGKHHMETSVVDADPLGRLIFLLFLPGTVTLYYGDELGFDQNRNKSSSRRVMMWDDSDYSGFSSVEPLWDLDYGWEDKTVIAKNDSIDALKKMVVAKQTEVPLFINGIFDYEGDYHPTKSDNYRVS